MTKLRDEFVRKLVASGLVTQEEAESLVVDTAEGLDIDIQVATFGPERAAAIDRFMQRNFRD